MFTFFILRFVSTEEHNFYWQECYKSIRRYYPENEIIIIDNNSNKSLLNHNLTLENCRIIQSEYPNSRLFSPFYEILKLQDIDKAIIIHDGIIFNRHIDFDNTFNNIKFFWHFITHHYDNYNLEMAQLNLLNNKEECIQMYNSKQWYGCLGCITAIDNKFLKLLEEKYGLSILKTAIKNQDDAIAFERVLAVLSYSAYPEISKDLSYEGDISNMTWGVKYDQFIKDNTIENNKPFFKLFGARK